MSIDLRFSEYEPNGNPEGSGTMLQSRFAALKEKLHLPATMSTAEQMPLTTVAGERPFYDAAADILGVKTGISNVYLIGAPGSSHWVLVDAGMPGSAHKIFNAAERRFGKDIAPSAILLTHGHFDHVGALHTLLERWDVPVYAHPLEMPYLTGRSSYPPPDPSVGGGAMARMSAMYPRKPIDLGHHVRPLLADFRISQLSPDWRWIHTPGHSPGHVSFFRESDRTLIVGDAFVTIQAESLLSNLSLRPEVHGPPMYFTTDWHAARESVKLLAGLEPEVVAAGHGIPLRGENMRQALHRLAREFELLAVPDQGRYVYEPALADENGVVSIPPHMTRPWQPAKTMALMLGVMVGGFLLSQLMPQRRKSFWEALLRE